MASGLYIQTDSVAPVPNDPMMAHLEFKTVKQQRMHDNCNIPGTTIHKFNFIDSFPHMTLMLSYPMQFCEDTHRWTRPSPPPHPPRVTPHLHP